MRLNIMRLKFKYTIFAVFCCLLLMSSGVSAQSEIEFPEIDGWEKGEVRSYPTAELGYSIPYQSETGGTVTIYVYNGGRSKIADGIDDKYVKSEIENAKSDIKAAGENGAYQGVKKIKDGTVTLGGADGSVKALYSLFNFKIQGTMVDSEIYLFGYNNNFIKIRATRLKGKNGASNDDLNALLKEIDKLFSKKAPSKMVGSL